MKDLIGMLAGYRVRSGLESGSKVTRADALSGQVEAGNVVLVRGAWNKKFVDECGYFPNGDFADQVDASSRAFHRLARKRLRSRRLVAPKVVERAA